MNWQDRTREILAECGQSVVLDLTGLDPFFLGRLFQISRFCRETVPLSETLRRLQICQSCGRFTGVGCERLPGCDGGNRYLVWLTNLRGRGQVCPFWGSGPEISEKS